MDFYQELSTAFSLPDVTHIADAKQELLHEIAGLMRKYPLHEPLQKLKLKTEIHYYHSLRVGVMFYDVVKGQRGIHHVIPPHSLLAAGVLHDYGKAFLPDEVLKKAGQHNHEERQIMRSHNSLSYAAPEMEQLEKTYFPYLREIAIRHHPYPRGTRQRRQTERRALAILSHVGRRKQERRTQERRAIIPALNRAGTLLSLCDQYDAWNSRREYKEPDTVEQVKEKFSQNFPQEDYALLEYLLENFRNPKEK